MRDRTFKDTFFIQFQNSRVLFCLQTRLFLSHICCMELDDYDLAFGQDNGQSDHDDYDLAFGQGNVQSDPEEEEEPLFLNSLNTNLLNVANESTLSKKRKHVPEESTSSDEKENRASEFDDIFANALTLGGTNEQQGLLPISQQSAVTEPKDYSQPPSTGAFITATTSSGEKLYFPKKTRQTKKAPQSVFVKEHMAQSTLLANPIWKMLEEMELEAVNKLRAFEMEEKEHDDRLFDEAMRSPPKKRKKDKKQNLYKRVDHNALWVDKYRPASFVDLLGDQVRLD